MRLIGELNAKYASPRKRRFSSAASSSHLQPAAGRVDGLGAKARQAARSEQIAGTDSTRFPSRRVRSTCCEVFAMSSRSTADTQLPRGTAARLVGAMAHPLNQAVIDPRLRMVTEGYGILQPRIGVAVQSTASSRLAAIYSGQSGFDIYTRAISDAYQDLFGEGIFTGKGIYEVATLHAVLDRRFPRNALLSHDLIEGAYARAGLVTDVELIDDYPSHYSAYIRRKHRWVRGDWQIAQWMFSRVPDESGTLGGRIRSRAFRAGRSSTTCAARCVDPAFFILFRCRLDRLARRSALLDDRRFCCCSFPPHPSSCFALAAHSRTATRTVGESRRRLWQASMVALLHLMFLPHQMLLAFDAILRSLVRRFITGERLLEWETAAQSEVQTRRRIRSIVTWRELRSSLSGLACLSVTRGAETGHLVAAAHSAALGLCRHGHAWLNRPPHEQHRICGPDREFSGRMRCVSGATSTSSPPSATII